jgi:hypothetical protein
MLAAIKVGCDKPFYPFDLIMKNWKHDIFAFKKAISDSIVLKIKI